MIIDFLGMANFFGTPTLNATWWYMSFAVLLIFVVPVLCFAVKTYGKIIVIVLSVLLPLSAGANLGMPIWTYLFTIVLGIISAESSWFEKIRENIMLIWYRKFIIVSLAFVLCILIIWARIHTFSMSMIIIYDALFTLLLAFVSIFLLNKIPLIRNMLISIGKYSMNMFLIHTFIKAYYFHDFSYGWKHSFLILLILLIDTWVISFVIEWGKRKVGFYRVQTYICERLGI